jgi:hypothetical protein
LWVFGFHFPNAHYSGIVCITVLLLEDDNAKEIPSDDPQQEDVRKGKGASIPVEDKSAQQEVSRGKEPVVPPPPSIKKCYILPPLMNLSLEEGSTTVHFHVRPWAHVPRFDLATPPTLVQLGYAHSIASSSQEPPAARTPVVASLGAFAIQTDKT